ncbi:S-adenosyl-L-methionine-dependent methyltransferase [Penicillium verhagenii]|nr:S-adenosyl-L-methionine-dependent methyltransferase [Penicillium verhagenii]
MGDIGVDRVELLSTYIFNCARSRTRKLSQENDAESEASSIVSACRELESLLSPPEDWIGRMAGSYNNGVALCLVLDMEIPKILSEQELTSLEKLVNISGASPSLLRGVMTQCVHSKIFDEPLPAHYKLNSHSTRLLDPNFASWIHYLVDDGFQMASCIPRYASENNFQIPHDQHETAFGMAFKTHKPFYQYYHTVDKARGNRFDSAMERYFHRSTQTPIEDFFEFGKLPPAATIVDVGGGRGHHSIRLASQYPQMSFINQDLGKKDPTLKETMDESILKRVTWQEHDFFQEQPVKGASVYMLSHILMDNTDSDGCKILQNVVTAMTPNESILLIDDFLDPGKEGTLPLKANTLNLHLIAAFGRPFRTMEEWAQLFLRVSPSLRIISTSAIGNGRVVFKLSRED